ncbi:hypothetical protein [Klebsiella pneumoniae IS43]|uniref:Uncharacterized protein n=1 Tax=Klebsiella pneumoniae IS43 TaxID=1432552 RepID=W1DV69_KLEPN|nr:hypothetical protein [Klebsiella pneumoniae IS43]
MSIYIAVTIINFYVYRKTPILATAISGLKGRMSSKRIFRKIDTVIVNQYTFTCIDTDG